MVLLMELKPSPIALAVQKLFERLETDYSPLQNQTFSDTDLLELHGIFGETLKLALDIVDRDRVKIYRNTNLLRELIEIPGHQSVVYKLLPNINYCSCQAFQRKVLFEQQSFTCKHVLAAKLAQILGKVTEEIVTDDLFNFLIQLIQ